MNEGPMALYRGRVAAGAFRPDPAQRRAVEELQLLHMRLGDYNPARPKRVGLGLFATNLQRCESARKPAVRAGN